MRARIATWAQLSLDSVNGPSTTKPSKLLGLTLARMTERSALGRALSSINRAHTDE